VTRGAGRLRGLALRAEDVVQRTVPHLLLRAGRPVRVIPFSGTAGARGTVVTGRVLVQLSGAQPPTRASSGWQLLRANLVPFVTVEVPHARVRVDVGGRSQLVTADREGYVSAAFDDLRLSPGRHPVVLTPVEPTGTATHGTVHAPDPAADLAVVSDIDDTVVDSGVAHGPAAVVQTVLLSDATARVPLGGAPELYRALAQRHEGQPQRPVFYVSTSPWNLSELLEDFLHRHGFPSGPAVAHRLGSGPDRPAADRCARPQAHGPAHDRRGPARTTARAPRGQRPGRRRDLRDLRRRAPGPRRRGLHPARGCPDAGAARPPGGVRGAPGRGGRPLRGRGRQHGVPRARRRGRVGGCVAVRPAPPG
jgi:hypothetical protein